MNVPDVALVDRYGQSLGPGVSIKPGLMTLDFQSAAYDEMATTIFPGVSQYNPGPLFMRVLSDLQLTSRGLEQCVGYSVKNSSALAGQIRNISDFDNSTTPPTETSRPIVLSANGTLGQLNVYDWNGAAFQLRGNIAPGATILQGDGSFVQYGSASYYASNTAGATAIQKKIYGANYADAPGTPPTASAIIQLGNRLIAIAAGNDYTKVQWTDNGNYDSWTGSSSGSAIVLPEGYSNDQDPMVAPMLVEQGALIFRRNTVVLMSPTGVSAAPFRFATVVPGLGLAGKQALARSCLSTGFFFASDGYNIYYYDKGETVDIGFPIQGTLRLYSQPSMVLAIDEVNGDLWVLNGGPSGTIYRFNVIEFLARKRVLWSVVNTSNFPAGLGSVNVDTIGSVYESTIAFNTTLKSLWIAGTAFKIMTTTTATVGGGSAQTVDIRVPGNEITLDRFRLIGYNYGGVTPSQVAVRFSMDTGATWSEFTTLSPTSTVGFQIFDGTVNLTGKFIRVEITELQSASSKTFAVQRMELLINDRGRGTN